MTTPPTASRRTARRGRPRRGGRPLAALAAALVLAGCGAGGPGVQAGLDYNAADLGPLRIRNAWVVKSPDGRAFAVVLTVINVSDLPDRLAAVSVQEDGPDGTRPPPVLSAQPAMVVPARAIGPVGGPCPTWILVPDPQNQVSPGAYTTVTLRFAVGETRVGALVEEPDEFLVGYAPAPVTAGGPTDATRGCPEHRLPAGS